jgi:hypothetical protein
LSTLEVVRATRDDPFMRPPLALAALVLCLAACGGGDDNGGGSTHPLGEEVVVEHAEATGAKRATTLGITVLEVREGTQAQLKAGGFRLDPEEQTATPYYVETRFANQGSGPIGRLLSVAVETDDGATVRSTTVINLGGPQFEQCPQTDDGVLAAGQSFERCQLFLVPEGQEPSRVSLLPYDPETPTDFVYWDAA